MNRKTLIVFSFLLLVTANIKGQDAAVLVPYFERLLANARKSTGLEAKALSIQQAAEKLSESATFIKNIETTNDIIYQADNIVCMIQEYHILDALKSNIVSERGVNTCLLDASNEIILIKANWVFDQTEFILGKLSMNPAERQKSLNDIVTNLDELITEILTRTNLLNRFLLSYSIEEASKFIIPDIPQPEFELPRGDGTLGKFRSGYKGTAKGEIYKKPSYEYGIDEATLTKGKKAILKIANHGINIILLIYTVSSVWAIMRGKDIGQVLINIMVAIIVWDIIKIVLG